MNDRNTLTESDEAVVDIKKQDVVQSHGKAEITQFKGSGLKQGKSVGFPAFFLFGNELLDSCSCNYAYYACCSWFILGFKRI